MAQNPIVTITMENGDVMKAELYPEIAPNTVNNFISLIKKGFYDGVCFHRIIAGFMIQGGDPEGTGMGGPGYSIKGEFNSNGFKNDLKHSKGVLSMARTQIPDSAGAQFFIMHADILTVNMQHLAHLLKVLTYLTTSQLQTQTGVTDQEIHRLCKVLLLIHLALTMTNLKQFNTYIKRNLYFL